MAALADSMTGDHPARPVLVLSSDPAAAGLDRARARGIEAMAVDRSACSREAFEARIDAALREAGADLVCLAGFMRILSPGFVEAWAGRMLNVHPSLLPRHPGLDTHARVLAAGDSHHGCTVHEVTAAVDGGPILGQARIPVRAQDTAATLASRVRAVEHLLYPAVLRRFAAGARTPIDMTP
jgi:phosphoribosylglycinamide formyltransferase-1